MRTSGWMFSKKKRCSISKAMLEAADLLTYKSGPRRLCIPGLGAVRSVELGLGLQHPQTKQHPQTIRLKGGSTPWSFITDETLRNALRAEMGDDFLQF